MVGRSPRKLGVRIDAESEIFDVVVDHDGMVGPDSGGMSVAPESPTLLQQHRRPHALGGTGPDDPAWSISPEILPEGLGYKRDKATHGFIFPARRMPLEEYEELLASLHEAWEEWDGR